MAKPRIKLKAATSRRPPSAIADQRAERVLSQLGEAVKMTAAEIRQDPLKARARREQLERIHAGGAPTVDDVMWMCPEAVEAIMVNAERQRVMAIAKVCHVTGQHHLLAKLAANGSSEEEARSHIFDVAAAESDGLAIHNGHSPEGGHRAGIDYRKIYDRQNRKKGGVA